MLLHNKDLHKWYVMNLYLDGYKVWDFQSKHCWSLAKFGLTISGKMFFHAKQEVSHFVVVVEALYHDLYQDTGCYCALTFFCSFIQDGHSLCM